MTPLCPRCGGRGDDPEHAGVCGECNDVRAYESRCRTLNGHRNRWRNHAFLLVDLLQSLDPEAEPATLRAAVKSARGRVAELFEEKESE